MAPPSPAAAAARRRGRRPHRRRHRRGHRKHRRLTRAQAQRLLWRAGFGPRPGELDALTRMTRRQAVHSLTRPAGPERMLGPDPRTADGALAPFDRDGHDHLWWLDQMVRTSQPLVQRLTLIFHDWFATSNEKVDNQRLMLGQYRLIRARVRGSFSTLFHDLTVDPAMLIWLDGVDNQAGDVNENYAREMMELFSLGAGRGAYTERDIREQARALTGWTRDNSGPLGDYNFRFDPSRRDTDPKTVFGHTGDWTWEDAVRLCLEHPLHPSFFVRKLWSYFNAGLPSPRLAASLARTYTSSGRSIRAVVERILLSDEFLFGPAMVKPPVVYTAGLLRGLGRGIDSQDWVGRAEQTGQRLFHPPNVSGWTKDRWLDTSTYRGRWDVAGAALEPRRVNAASGRYSRTETPKAALAAALRDVGRPEIGPAARGYLLGFARTCIGSPASGSDRSSVRAMRRNALRHLILTSPEHQVC